MSPWLRSFAAVGAIIFLGGLFFGGAQPNAAAWVSPPWDKLVHFIAYGGFTALLWVSFGGRRPWLGFGIAVLVGLLDETTQSALPTRIADPVDLLADSCGAAAVTWLLLASR